MLYVTFRAIFRLMYKVLFRLRVEGLENVPADGPVILCANHISLLDPPIVGIMLKRRVNYMAKQELFNIQILGSILPRLGAFPVKRGGISKDSIKRTLMVLRNGEILGIFPEGSRSNAGAGKKGAASFALRSDAVVIPVGVIGHYRLFRPMKVVYGKPLDMTPFRESDDPERVDHATQAIMDGIYGLINDKAA